jgi:hypothetical protein
VTDDAIAAFRRAAAQALEANDALHQANRGLAFSTRLEPSDIPVLRELIVRRIDVLPAFSRLVILDPQAARKVLLDRWLGYGVDPDTKYGGYAFELSSMLDDLREAGGDAALREVISDPRFARERLSDPRVLDSLGFALDKTSAQVKRWLAAH